IRAPHSRTAPPNHNTRLSALLLATDSITSRPRDFRSAPVEGQLAIALGVEVHDLSGRGSAQGAPLSEDLQIFLARQPGFNNVQIALFVEQPLLLLLQGFQLVAGENVDHPRRR